MKTSEINYPGDLRTQAIHLRSGEGITTDAPLDNEGKGAFFSPTDLVATALGCCIITVTGIAARHHNFNVDGMKVEITKIMTDNPRRIGEIVAELYYPPNNYTDRERQIIENTARTCPVSKSLHPDLKQTLIFHY